MSTSIRDKPFAPAVCLWTRLHEQVRVSVAHQDCARHRLVSVLVVVASCFLKPMDQTAGVLIDGGLLGIDRLATAHHHEMVVSKSFFALSVRVAIGLGFAIA